jgi:hypothetical protein
MKPTAQSVNIIDGTINGHGVKFVFYYQPTKADMANAHHATKNLENNLRDGVAKRKAHLFNLVENDITEYTDILTINSKDLEQLKNESEATMNVNKTIQQNKTGADYKRIIETMHNLNAPNPPRF